MPTDGEAYEGGQLLQHISRHVFIVMLHVSWPRLSFKIDNAKVSVPANGGSQDKEKEVQEKYRTDPKFKFCPEDWSKRLGNLEYRARTRLSNASIKFATRGMAVLPVTRAADVFSGFRTLREELMGYQEDFVSDYEQILADLKDDLAVEVYDQASGKMPSKQEIATKFGLTWAIVPAGGGSNINGEQIDLLRSILRRALPNANDILAVDIEEASLMLDQIESQLTSSAITDEEAAELIGEAREQMNKFTEQMLEDMAREPRQLLVDATDNLMEALTDPKRIVQNGTIAQVERAFEMVEGFSFLAGDELLAEIKRVRSRLNEHEVKQLNSDAEIGAKLAAGLQGVRDEAANARSAATAVRQFRGIRFRETADT